MSRYIPMPAYHDTMPVDISFVFEGEKPAGKHGFLQVDGDQLRFEDGTGAKFFGVNINGGANFPTHAYAEQFARRIAMVGCNIVRLHQLDAEWGIPNIFSFSRGKRVTSTRSLDPVSMERLDYLVHCLKQEGIYIYLDMMTYRKFKEGDGVVDADILPDLAKPWCLTNPWLRELQKEYMSNLWNHYNPYTGLCYKDDPAFVMTEIIAECDLFMDNHSQKKDYVPSKYYIDEFRGMFRDWLQDRSLEYDWENCDLFEEAETLIRFKMDVTRGYFREMYDHMRGLGVKIPITGTNWVSKGNHLTMCHDVVDFTDSHAYFGQIQWEPTERICRNVNITSLNTTMRTHPISMHVRATRTDKPFYLSEWDMLWPNSYRAESPIHFAAVAALQGWCGLSIHTYSYSTRLDKMQILGRELSSPVGGVAYREGIYATWNDPAKFGLFYHGALITRRGDVAPAKKGYAIQPRDFFQASDKAANSLLERSRIRMDFGEGLPEGYDETILPTETVDRPELSKVVSDHGQMWRNTAKQIGAVDTPSTKAVYGMLNTGTIDLEGMQVKCDTDFAVIAVSSLTNEPIENSDNLLLSAIGRARNSKAEFDGEKLLDPGQPPIMVEVIEADVRIKTDVGKKLKVWGINAEGYYAGKLATTYEDGWLSFHIGEKNNPACYYLIVKE